MTKAQFTKLATELGYSVSYSGHSKTFYLKGSIQLTNDFEQNQKLMDIQTSGFNVIYQ